MSYKFTETKVKVPEHDSDVILQLPNGKEITIQFRPSNADTNYPGSLDIILPDNEDVTCWEGDDMKPAKKSGPQAHCRFAKQLMMTLPFGYD